MLIGAGISATGGQFGNTLAYTQRSGPEVSIYTTQIIFASRVGYSALTQLPDRWSIGLGADCAALAICITTVTRPSHGKRALEAAGTAVRRRNMWKTLLKLTVQPDELGP